MKWVYLQMAKMFMEVNQNQEKEDSMWVEIMKQLVMKKE
jgi:hypothetical protein